MARERVGLSAVPPCLVFDVLLRDPLRAGDLAVSFEIEREGDHVKLRHVAGQVRIGVSA
jgi:hypothetical protein